MTWELLEALFVRIAEPAARAKEAEFDHSLSSLSRMMLLQKKRREQYD
jgi:hypothetical protein